MHTISSRTNRRRTRRALAMIAAIISGTAWAGVSAAPASAAPRPTISTSTADMFWCTSTQSLCTQTTVTTVQKGTPLKMVCWRDDRNAFGGAGTSRWFYSILDNGQEGYLLADQVTAQTPNTPRCDTINWLQVSDFAIGHIGQVQASATEAAAFTAADWAPGPVGEWQGDCIKFAHLAWGKQTKSGNAIDVYNAYKRANLVRTGRPPRGALVFWNRSSLGHVAISLGNWQAVGTQGLDNQRPVQPIARYGVNTADYLGWVMPVTPTVPQNVS